MFALQLQLTVIVPVDATLSADKNFEAPIWCLSLSEGYLARRPTRRPVVEARTDQPPRQDDGAYLAMLELQLQLTVLPLHDGERVTA